jgi:RNA polymerase sigma-70 factor (ECF subfamily)
MPRFSRLKESNSIRHSPKIFEISPSAPSLRTFTRQISAPAASLIESMPSSFSLGRLYQDHGQALFAFLLNLTRSESDTRDLLQELFVKLAKHPTLLDGVREERAFLIRLAHNLAIDQIRRRGTREKNYGQLAGEMASVFAASVDLDEQAFRQALEDALGELPPEQRTVVHLKLWERMTFEAIAEALDIPLNTAASRYRYGLDKLRERLRPLYEEIK